MRKEIENKIAELDIIIAGDDKVHEENNQLYWDAEKRLEAELKQHLINAGLPVNEFTRIDLRFNRSSVCVYFKIDKNRDFSVTFSERKVHEVNATGINCRGNSDEFEGVESYYNMISQILGKLNPKKCITYHSFITSFFDTLENYKEPEFKKYKFPEMQKIREEKKQLETQLKELSLELKVGKTVEVYFEGTSKWRRPHWMDATIERMTEKMIYVDCKAYGTKAIKRIDVLNYIRNKPVETCHAQEGN